MSKCAVQKRKTIFILIAILVMLLTFKFGYLDAVVHIKALDSENLRLRGQIIDLNEYIDRQDEYESYIWQINQSKDAIIDRYGVGVTPEKISLFMHEVGERTGAEINDITFGKKTLVEFENEGNTRVDESKETGMSFYKTLITINLKANYSQLKGVIALIQSGSQKMSIESIKADLENNGKLSTTIVLDAYAISGTDKQYETPKIDVPIGNESPLGEIKAEKTEKVQDDEKKQ